MNILYYFPELPTVMYQWQRVHFFEELAYHNVCFDTFNPLLCKSWEEANERLVKKIEGGGFDLFFTSVCHKDALFVDTLDKLKQKGIPSLCLRCDNLVMPFYDKYLSPYFDLIWLTSKETEHLYKKWGAKSIFAPYAASPYSFRFEDRPLLRAICFVGTPYGSRTRMMNTLVEGGVSLSLYYGKQTNIRNNVETPNIKPLLSVPSDSFIATLFNRMRFKEGRKLLEGTFVNKLRGGNELIQRNNVKTLPSVALRDIYKVYSQYALSLASTSAVHTDILKDPLKIINLRNFEIPMSGGIEFCRYNPELAEYFEADKEIVFYNDNNELVDKAIYYTNKASDKEIFNIKIAARKRAEAEHSWYCRFKRVLAEIEITI